MSDLAHPDAPLTVLVKPSGPDCNLTCEYCFYRDRAALYPSSATHRMSEETLRELVRKYMNYSEGIAAFAWQGGEPTLMGLDFFKRAVELQQLYGRPGQAVSNSLQSNGLLLDDPAWGRFLHDYRFLVGLSLDGPADSHDAFRVTQAGQGSHDRVLRGLDNLLGHGVEVNILTMVQPANVHRPAQTYEYLLSLGISFLQFIPLAEPNPSGSGLMPFSICPQDYGHFLCEIFDLWVADKPRAASVRMFDDMLAVLMGHEHPTCMFGAQCGRYVVVEHSGDFYACDFFVEEQWHLGNIHEIDFGQIARLDRYREFQARKTAGLSECPECEWFRLCHGGCPKFRVMQADVTRPTYFCEAYRMFFEHSYDRLHEMARRLGARQVAQAENVGRNDPCPCGSGHKFKNCCSA